MGGKGPPRIPTEILKRRGSWKVNNRKDIEIKPVLAVPECPPWASDLAKRHWNELGNYFYKLGIMTDMDQVALGLLLDILSMYIEAKKQVEADRNNTLCASNSLSVGIILYKADGTTMANPAVKVMFESWDRVLKMCAQFGMTPASRAGLGPKGQDPGKPEEAIRKGRFFESA